MALNSNFRTLTADNIEGIVDDRNYLKSSFENGTITGWTEVAVALTSGLPTGTPTISSTAASSLALSATSVTPLSGSRSLLVDVPSALTAGHGFISDEFTLDRMDLGKVLTVSFDYERVTGTYNFSGVRGSQTWMVYIYDATLGAANWIQPAGFLGMNQSSGPGRVACTFQSSVTAGQKYRVAVIASQAAAGASSIEFDNFTASRQTAPIGPVVTDWVSYTPTGSWTSNTTYTGQWRRVGDSMQGKIRVALTGAPNNTQFLLNLPSGYSIDTSKLPNGIGSSVGLLYVEDFGVTGYDGFVFMHTTTTVSIKVQDTAAAFERSSTVTSNTIPFAWNNQDYMVFDFQVPISGWSSNVQLSNDTDTRVVVSKVFNLGGQLVGSASWTKCTSLSSTPQLDTHAAYDGTNKRIIFPVSGFYTILCQATFAANGSGARAVGFTLNGGAIPTEGGAGQPGIASDTLASTYQSTISVRAGEYVELAVYQSSGGNLNLISAGLQVSRLSGPSVVAASETVACHVETSAGPILSTGIGSAISFPTKLYDTHNSFSGNTYTVPVSGKYRITAYFTIVNTSGTNIVFSDVYVNGALVKNLMALYPYLSVAQNHRINGSVTLNLTAGQTIQIYAGAGSAIGLFTSGVYNYLCIERVGN